MEQELDEEYLAELLKEPKNVIFDTLADHLLGNVHSECCELLLLNMEKCRLYRLNRAVWHEKVQIRFRQH